MPDVTLPRPDRSPDWIVHPWRTCPGCHSPRRVTHRRLGTCVSCALPVLRREDAELEEDRVDFFAGTGGRR